MLTTAIFIALGLLVACLSLFYKPKFALAAAIPFIFGAYFTFSAEMNNHLGYAANIGVVKKTDAMFISGFQLDQKIYFMVVELGKDTPRLVEFPAGPEMQKALEELSKDDATVSKRITIGVDVKDMLEKLYGADKDAKTAGNKDTVSKGLGGWTDVEATEGLKLHMDENWLPPKQR